MLGDSVFVGYGDGHLPDGSDGLSSQVVQYNMKGHVVHIYTVLGHNDGIKINPATRPGLGVAKRRRQCEPGDY